MCIIIAQSAVSMLNTRNDFIRRYIERVTSISEIIASGVAVRGDSGVAGERRVVGIPKFYPWRKCTMPLTNISSDWMFNASSDLCIILCYIILGYIILFTWVL